MKPTPMQELNQEHVAARQPSVLHVVEPPSEGVPVLAGNYADALLEAGWRVGALLPTEVTWFDSRVHAYDWRPRRRSLASLLSSRARLAEVIADFKPDVLHLHSTVAGWLGRTVATDGAGVVFQPHAWSFNVAHEPIKSGLAAVERVLARRTGAFVVNCSDEAEEGRAAGVDGQYDVVGVTVDTEHFRPPSEQERNAARRRVGLNSDVPVVLVMGRIARQKGQDQFIAEWTRVPRSATLAIVGSGDASELRNMSRDKPANTIIFAGVTRNPRDWYWAADVVAMPSRYEGFPMVAAEALACGAPLVTTAFNGAQQYLRPPDLVGGVVALGDMPALVSGVIQLCGTRRERDEKRRALAMSHFGQTAIVGRLERAYARAMFSAGGSLSGIKDGEF